VRGASAVAAHRSQYPHRRGYLGSGLSARMFKLFDGSSVLVVSSVHGTLVIPIEE
jgi:hypothetical protein